MASRGHGYLGTWAGQEAKWAAQRARRQPHLDECLLGIGASEVLTRRLRLGLRLAELGAGWW